MWKGTRRPASICWRGKPTTYMSSGPSPDARTQSRIVMRKDALKLILWTLSNTKTTWLHHQYRFHCRLCRYESSLSGLYWKNAQTFQDPTGPLTCSPCEQISLHLNKDVFWGISRISNLLILKASKKWKKSNPRLQGRPFPATTPNLARQLVARVYDGWKMVNGPFTSSGSPSTTKVTCLWSQAPSAPQLYAARLQPGK